MKTALRITSLLAALMLLCSCRVAQVIEIISTPAERAAATAALTTAPTATPVPTAAPTTTPSAVPTAKPTTTAIVTVKPSATAKPVPLKSFLPLSTTTPKPTRLTPSKWPSAPVATASAAPTEAGAATPDAGDLAPSYELTDYGIEVQGYGYGYTLDSSWQPQEVYGMRIFYSTWGMASAITLDESSIEELSAPDGLKAELLDAMRLLGGEDIEVNVIESRKAVFGGVEGHRAVLQLKNVQDMDFECRLILLPAQGGVCMICILYPLSLSFLPTLADKIEETIGPR